MPAASAGKHDLSVHNVADVEVALGSASGVGDDELASSRFGYPAPESDDPTRSLADSARALAARAELPADALSSAREDVYDSSNITSPNITDGEYIDISLGSPEQPGRSPGDIEAGPSELEYTPSNASVLGEHHINEDDQPGPARPGRGYDLKRVLFAFTFCWLSTFVGQVLRMPLSSAKVNLQRNLGLTTLDLTHLDTAFSVCHVFGQMSSPALSSKTNNVALIAMYQFVMGFAMTLLFAPNSMGCFMVVYAFAGFVSGPVWAVLFSHLSEWLPKEYSFPLITVWFTGSDLGAIAGALICIYAHESWGWRSPYVVSGLLNMLVAVLMFCLYDNSKEPTSDGRIVDPRAIVRNNFRQLGRYARRIRRRRNCVESFIATEHEPPAPAPDSRREFILSGLSNIQQEVKETAAGSVSFSSLSFFMRSRASGLYSKVHRVSVDYVSALFRVSYIGRIAVASFILKLVKNCFSSWVNFYVSTMFAFTVAQGNYVSLTFSVGNCVGNMLVAFVCHVFWKGRPLTACTYFCGATAVAVLVFSLMNFSWPLLSYFFCFTTGVATAATEAILMARGIKSLCDRSELNQQESLVVYGFLLAISTVRLGHLVRYVRDCTDDRNGTVAEAITHRIIV
ncbi:MFS general substrate transporter domain containing protein,putative [Babesia bigemina]|uniref:MFS general substrate transporter domain containing protein,putative n=1 Tax=Babesia bigemina TaxID=5866 RepID=A0A061D571_BABBI|nr:MFS general substrate transporter domain containing protein,putative [Babesia bigemina]CDR95713.1 MFS general substrate transporter domain containing protein,putative [Babesia bigemina]|eukprot:XP_012767899.1 MFS general substrate transporter domain containing protein,putative [Babesia bigemina]